MSVVLSAVTRLTQFNADLRVYRAVVTFDTAYQSGGEYFSFVAYMEKVSAIIPLGLTTNGYIVSVDQQGTSLVAKAWYGNYDAADGPLIEVAGGTNLGAEAVTLLLIGPGLGAA